MAITKAFVQSILQKNMPQIGEGRVLCTYKHSAANPTYDASTSVITDTKTEFSVYGTFVDFKLSKNQAGVQEEENEPTISRDKKCIVEAREMGVIVPAKDDIIVDPDGTEWAVVGWNTDPYDAAYIFKLKPQVDS